MSMTHTPKYRAAIICCLLWQLRSRLAVDIMLSVYQICRARRPAPGTASQVGTISRYPCLIYLKERSVGSTYDLKMPTWQIDLLPAARLSVLMPIFLLNFWHPSLKTDADTSTSSQSSRGLDEPINHQPPPPSSIHASQRARFYYTRQAEPSDDHNKGTKAVRTSTLAP